MSAQRFSVGDRVRIVYSPAAPELLGEVTEVLRVRRDRQYGLAYYVAVKLPGFEGVLGPAYCFAPYGDSDKPARWRDCVWQPQRVNA